MPDRPATLRVCALYPDLMNIYADRGNLLMLERRCNWRWTRIRADAAPRSAIRSIRTAPTCYYIGGGQDRDQELCAEDLAERKREALHAAAARGAVVLAVCGGYQLLGHEYELGERTLPGVGLVDLRTVRADGPRLIGNVAIEVELERRRAAHAGRLREPWRPHPPRRRAPSRSAVCCGGHGNNGGDGFEGVRQGNVIGTYLHGPLLPKNAWFADWLIGAALVLDEPLAPLDDELEELAHEDAIKAAGL